MKHASLFLFAFCFTSLLGCGSPEEAFVATFTSDVIQLNTCRSIDGSTETCVEDEFQKRYRVTLMEDEEQRVWISGIQRGDGSDRRMLGTRDSQGGFLFTEETTQKNLDSQCTLTTQVSISLAIDEDATEEQIGTDPCVALVGRETKKTITSTECDDINDPAQEITRINRRRWEKAVDCGDD